MITPEPDSDSARSSLLSAGQLIAGKYRIEGVLGEGGMGVVYAVQHEMLAQTVALKILRPEVLGRADSVQRFINEARAAARIRNEHVARVMDVGILPESGQPYMVMERLSGKDVAQLLQEQGPLPVATAIDWALQGLDALADAHAMGIIHRDLKPANLFVADVEGVEMIKMLDFGISKAGGAFSLASNGATSTKAILGTPGYMSPEQLRSSKNVDSRSDIWAMGVVLFEMLAGTLPFQGETVGELFANIIESEIPLLRARRPEAPERLEAIIARCLRRKPDERFNSVAELGIALAEFGSGVSAASVARLNRHLAGTVPIPGSGSHTRMSEPSLAPRTPPNTGQRTVPLTPPPQNFSVPPEAKVSALVTPSTPTSPNDSVPAGVVAKGVGPSTTDGGSVSTPGTWTSRSSAPPVGARSRRVAIFGAIGLAVLVLAGWQIVRRTAANTPAVGMVPTDPSGQTSSAASLPPPRDPPPATGKSPDERTPPAVSATASAPPPTTPSASGARPTGPTTPPVKPPVVVRPPTTPSAHVPPPASSTPPPPPPPAVTPKPPPDEPRPQAPPGPKHTIDPNNPFAHH